MRVRLNQGKQKELILLAKGSKTWKEFSKEIQKVKNYLARDIKNEKVLLDEETYNKLCEITKKNFDVYIKEKLDNNWGRVKGGLNSPGNTIKIKEPKKDRRLAEVIGAILGDGNINAYKKGKKVGTYQIRIAGDINKDKEYHINYLKPICKDIFGINPKEILLKKKNERFVVLYSKELVQFFSKIGIKPGDKIKNQSTIPKWIIKNKNYLKYCLRGLIDTDGSVHRMSKKNPNLIRINFKNHNLTLLKHTREAFLKLGFNPCKIINNKVFYLSKQKEIKKYLKEVGFSNNKHIKRIKEFTAHSSSGQG